MTSSPASPPTSREWAPALALFLVLLGVHAWGVSVRWTNGNLPGNEFRQAQTALSALFIQRDGGHALAYPTPVFGAPWSLPMEFPLYQWTVVALSDATGWPLLQAGRAVTLACFYLALAALYPLLGRLGLAPARRLVVMGLVLSCPLYVFYARSFLIESMALALSLWFLVAFVRFMSRPGWGWFTVAGVLGVVAGLVKVTTFMAFLIPAGLLTAWQMRGEAARGWGAMARVGFGALAVIALPLAMTAWWTRFADSVKVQNFNAAFLRSTNLVGFNFGTSETRFSADTLNRHWENLTGNLVTLPVLVIALLLAATVGRRWWRQIVFLLACYVATLVLFPTLYAWHDYYAMTNAVLVLAAVGLALAAALDARRAWVVWSLLVAVHATQIHAYMGHYYRMQEGVSPGGSDMTRAVRAMTNESDALVSAGYDWDSSVAFYSGRRALMIRAGMERDWRYLHAAFQDQVARGQKYKVFVGRGAHGYDDTLLMLLEQYFDIDRRPLFRWEDVIVYGVKAERGRMVDALKRVQPVLSGVRIDPVALQEPWTMVRREVWLEELLSGPREVFSLFDPLPVKFFTDFGVRRADVEGRDVMLAHAATRLWFRVPAGERVLRAEFALQPEAYAASIPPGDRSDGVEFYVDRERPDGTRERLKSVFLNPREVPADAGFHTLEVSVGGAAEETIIIGTGPGPHGNGARDWSVFSRIQLLPPR